MEGQNNIGIIDIYTNGNTPEFKQVVPRVGRPAVKLTVSKQTVMKKDVTICNIK